MTYEFLEHTADVQFRAEGTTIEEMFIEATKALNETIRGNINILEKEEKNITITGPDKEVLLHNLLEELLFLLEAKDYLTARIKELNYNEETLTIKATLTGDKAEHYKFTNDVKAITFNNMYIKKNNKQHYECQVVLDV